VKYIQIVLSIETMLDLSTLTIEDVTGRLQAVDERIDQATTKTDSGKLLLTEEEWAARMKEKKFGEASSSRGGDGKRRGKASSEKKKIDPNACRRCGKTGHWAKECPNRKQEKKAEAQVDDEDETAFLMASFCALHDVEAEEVAMAEQGKAFEGCRPRRAARPSPSRTCGQQAGAEVVPGLRRQQPHDELQGGILRGRWERDRHGEVWRRLKGGDPRARHHHLQVLERRAPHADECVLHPAAVFKHHQHWAAG
jgi:hypothetical protein